MKKTTSFAKEMWRVPGALVVSMTLLFVGCVVVIGQYSGLGGNVPGATAFPAVSGNSVVSVRSGQNVALLNEYQKLQQELMVVNENVRRLEQRLRDDPRPPMTNGDEFQHRGERDAAMAFHPSDHDTIFVSVASFRDAECPETIRDMVQKAKNPRRVFFGVVEQNYADDIPCTPLEYENCTDTEFCPKDNIRVRRVHPLDARGPTFGRFVAMLMYRGEKYFMMIDSHNRFVRRWDSRMIAMHRLLPTRKGVLSHYPNKWSNNSEELEGQGYTTVMCNAHFIQYGYLRMDGMAMTRSTRPRPQPFSAAGFLFANAQLVREVPFDPYLDYIFDGEELLYSVRMWTHGFDIFAPSESLLFHYYIRSGAPRVWSHVKDWIPIQQKSAQRIQYLLKVTKENTTERIIPDDTKLEHVTRELDRYGLGKERSLEDYWKFAKVDPIFRKAGNEFCDMVK